MLDQQLPASQSCSQNRDLRDVATRRNVCGETTVVCVRTRGGRRNRWRTRQVK